jgi:putative endonuclease
VSSSSRIGTIGEKKAAAFLKESGYAVIEQNYRLPWGEVDLIARDNGTLVFCEVKTWNTFAEENLEKAVGRAKQKKIVRVAKHFIKSYPEYGKDRIRFDVILVKDHLASINHIKNAFGVSHG